MSRRRLVTPLRSSSSDSYPSDIYSPSDLITYTKQTYTYIHTKGQWTYNSTRTEQSYSSHGENTTNTEPPLFIEGTSAELTEISSLENIKRKKRNLKKKAERLLRTQKHKFQLRYKAVRDLPVHLCISVR